MSDKTTLVDEPTFLMAAIQSGGPGPDTLSVYASPVVATTDPVYAPVAEALSEGEWKILETHRVTDPHMMFGEGLFVLYVRRVWE